MFSRNFGENAAVDAGFKVAMGDYIVKIDSDLQNDPEDIPKIISKLKEGYGVVKGWRKDRYQGDKWIRVLFSKMANWLIRKITGVQLHDFSSPLEGYRREFIEDINLLGETFVFLSIFAHDRGAKIFELPITHKERKSGMSKHSVSEMMFVFFDLISIKFLLKYFTKPLRFFGSASFLFLFLAIMAFVWSFYLKFADIENFSDTPLPIMGTMLIILSVLTFMMGFITEILLRIYYENKGRSQYMIYEILKNK
jgi:dolichol-phosphate mannosyltransferase